MIYIRGNERDYNSWQALGNIGWSYQDVCLTSRNRKTSSGEHRYFGVDGPLSITDPLPVSQRFVAAIVHGL